VAGGGAVVVVAGTAVVVTATSVVVVVSAATVVVVDVVTADVVVVSGGEVVVVDGSVVAAVSSDASVVAVDVVATAVVVVSSGSVVAVVVAGASDVVATVAAASATVVVDSSGAGLVSTDVPAAAGAGVVAGPVASPPQDMTAPATSAIAITERISRKSAPGTWRVSAAQGYPAETTRFRATGESSIDAVERRPATIWRIEMREAIRVPGLPRVVRVMLVALIVLALVSAAVLLPPARAGEGEGTGTTMPGEVEIAEPKLTELAVEGVGSRSVSYDGAIGRFTVSVLRDSLITAVSDGNKSVQAIADKVAEDCTKTEPETADHTAPPTCISPNGLQTVGIRIEEEFDWTDQGRVSRGFRYENRLSIAIRGTGFAGGLVDMVINSGGDNVRFDGLDFTVSRRAEFERLALLDAIDDAQATARAIVDHMGYEIVRIVRITPGTAFDPYLVQRLSGDDAAVAESASVPTPVFGGSEVVTSRVSMLFELRPKA